MARYGGEEFVVLLQETTLDGGQEVAERIAPPWRPGAAHGDSDVSPYLP